MATDTYEKIRALIKKNQAPFTSPEAMRAALDATGGPLPEGVSGTATNAGGVPAEWSESAGAATDRVVLYLHGGGYAAGSLTSHHNLVGHITRAMGCRVLALDYRLAPEHRHPAQVQDSVGAYRWLLDEGIAAPHIAVAGDSAGGGLAVATLVAIRDQGLPQPGGAVAISPWVDMTASGDSTRSRAEVDLMITPDTLATMADLFLGPDGDRRDPLASPLFADLSGLAPLLIQVGDHEVLLDDSVRLAAGIEATGGEVELEVWPEMLHVWHAFAGWAPESDQAIARIADWLRPRLGLS